MAHSDDINLDYRKLDGESLEQRDERQGSFLSQTDSFESGEDPRAYGNVEYDPDLDCKDNEEGSWSEIVDPEIFRQFSAKDRKRQDVIYELIQTETQYVRILNVTKKVYRDGMKTELGFSVDVLTTIFPALDEILELNKSFLDDLRAAQSANENFCVDRVGNIILKHCGDENGARLQEAYAYFVSHKEKAVKKFKELYKDDIELQQFSERCVRDKRTRRLYLDECLTYITMRLTKYPLLIEAIVKATRESDPDYGDLKRALMAVKDVLTGMNTQVQLEDIRQRIDNLSTVETKPKDANHHGKQFKGYKVISSNAKLMYETKTKLVSKNKVYDIVLVITNTKVIFFQEHSTTRKLHLLDVDPPVLQLKGILQQSKKAVDPRSAFIIGTSYGSSYLTELLFEREAESEAFIRKLGGIRQACVSEEEDDDITDDEEEAKREEEMRMERIKELLEDLDSTNNVIQEELERKNELLQMLFEFTSSGVESNGENGSEDSTATDNTPSENTSFQVQDKGTNPKSPSPRRKDFPTQRYTPPASPKARRRDVSNNDRHTGYAPSPSPKVRHKNVKSNSFGAVDKKTRRVSPVPSHASSLPMSLTSHSSELDKDSLVAKASWLSRKFLPQPKTHSDLSKFSSLSLFDLKSYHSYSEELRSFINTTNDKDLQIANLSKELHMCQLQKTKLEHELSASRDKVKKYKLKVDIQEKKLHAYEARDEQQEKLMKEQIRSLVRSDLKLVGEIDYQVHQV